MRPPSWTKKELKYLHNLCLEHCTARAADLFCEWQSRQKDSNNRSWKTVRRKAQSLNVPQLDGFSVRQWSDHLQIPRNRLERRVLKVFGNTTASSHEISSKQMKSLIAEYPEILHGCNLEPSRNWWGNSFVRRLNIPDVPTGQSKVKNCDTGEIYPSIRAASKAVFVEESTLRRALSRSGKCAGYKWQRIC